MPIFGDIYQSTVNLLRDDASSLNAFELEDAIARIVRGPYSQDRPRVVRATLNGAGTAQISLSATLLAAIADWGHPSSWVVRVEYPINIQEPRYLADGHFFLYPEFVEVPTHLAFISNVPASGTNNVALYYNAIHTAIRMPGIPTVTATGTTGATTYEYRVTARDSSGNETLPTPVPTGGTQRITNGNSTLSVSNYNRIRWQPVPGATDYKVYRTTGGATTGGIGTSSTTTYDDDGDAASGVVPLYNATTLTLPAKDIPAIACGAVSNCYLAIAGKHSGNTTSAFSGDAVGWEAMSDRAMSLSREFWGRYKAMLKPAAEDLKPAMSSVSFYPRTHWGGDQLWTSIYGPKGPQRGS